MTTRLAIAGSHLQDVTAAFASAKGKWTGCDWTSQFGQNHLNLKGLRSSQALLMERATAGSEAADWRDATEWLTRVERDAREAESEALVATRLAASGGLREAFARAKRACALEARYHESSIWRPLCDAIEAASSERHEPPSGS